MNTSTTSFLKKFQYGDTPSPARDWSILIVLVLLCILASALWNFFVFKRVVQGEILDARVLSTETATTETFDRVQKQFSEREMEAERYRTEYRFIDPYLK